MKGSVGTSMGSRIVETDDYYYNKRHRSAERTMIRRVQGFLERNKINIKPRTLIIDSSHDTVVDSGWLKGYTVRQLIEAYARTTNRKVKYG